VASKIQTNDDAAHGRGKEEEPVSNCSDEKKY